MYRLPDRRHKGHRRHTDATRKAVRIPKAVKMDDIIGNFKSQIEHFRGEMDILDGETDTEVKKAIAETETALFRLEKAIANKGKDA